MSTVEQNIYAALSRIPVLHDGCSDDDLVRVSTRPFRTYAMSTAYRLAERLNAMQTEEVYRVGCEWGNGVTFYVVQARPRR